MICNLLRILMFSRKDLYNTEPSSESQRVRLLVRRGIAAHSTVNITSIHMYNSFPLGLVEHPISE